MGTDGSIHDNMDNKASQFQMSRGSGLPQPVCCRLITSLPKKLIISVEETTTRRTAIGDDVHTNINEIESLFATEVTLNTEERSFS